MLDVFSKYINENIDNVFNKKVYLAISGGIDSMTLSHLLTLTSVSHTLLHCNFMLRGNESDEDELFLKKYAHENNLEIIVNRFDTNSIATKSKSTIQETARELRYNWFKETMKDVPNSILMTAHHLDDSIETFFINTLRGTGLKGLSGIPRFRNNIYRPLLNFTSEDIHTFSEVNGIIYREDSSNQDSKYLRNNIRNNIIPDLISIEPHLKAKMKVLLSDLNNTYQWIADKAQLFIDTNFIIKEEKAIISLNILNKEDPIFIQYILKDYNLNRVKLNAFHSFLSAKNGSLFFTEGYKFLIDRNSLIISKDSIQKVTNNSLSIEDANCKLNYQNKLISFRIVNGNKVENKNIPVKLDLNKVSFPLKLRIWNHGDKMTPLGMSGSKLLSDIFIDKKIDLFQKQNLIVLSDTSRIIAVLGIVINEHAKVDVHTTKMLEINLAAI